VENPAITRHGARRLYLKGTVMDEAKNCNKQAIEDLRLEAFEDLSPEEQQISALEDIAKSLSRMSDSIDRIVVQLTTIAAKLK
jgi:hypothetical protein